MKKQESKLFNRAPDGAKTKSVSKSVVPGRQQKIIISLIGWVIELIVEAVKRRKANRN